MILKRYLPCGETRGVWKEGFNYRGADSTAIPQRAGRVHAIDVTASPFCGCFCADLSTLADLLNRDDLRVCLFPPVPSYRKAQEMEEAYIEQEWVLGRHMENTVSI